MPLCVVDKFGGALGIRGARVDAGRAGFAEVVAVAVIGVNGGVAGIDLNEAIFRVVGVGVHAVVDEVSGAVVRVAVDSVVVGGIRGIVSCKGGGEGVRAVLLPAIAETVVNVAVRGRATGGSGTGAIARQVRANEPVERIVTVSPVAIPPVVDGEDVAIGSEARDIE